jgi:hypothetical protein
MMGWRVFFDKTQSLLVVILPDQQKAQQFDENFYKKALIILLKEANLKRALTLMEDNKPSPHNCTLSKQIKKLEHLL